MKFFFNILILALPVLTAQGGSREFLFDCAHTNNSSPLERLQIFERTKGSNKFFEVDSVAYIGGIEKVSTKKVNLISKYDGKILEFTTGNFRVKIDYVRDNGGYLWAFARVPDYDVHSFDWRCKEID